MPCVLIDIKRKPFELHKNQSVSLKGNLTFNEDERNTSDQSLFMSPPTLPLTNSLSRSYNKNQFI